jgi:DNA replication protein DnaC
MVSAEVMKDLKFFHPDYDFFGDDKDWKKQKEIWNSLSESEQDFILEERRLNSERIKQEEEAEERKKLIDSYRYMRIPKRYYDVSWENWNTDTEEKQQAVTSVKKAWDTNLFLCGKSGTGKTHLAMCLTKDGATYRRLPDIFREVKLDFNEEQEIIDRYGSRDLLIIDEVGRQKYSEFEKNLFFEIIDKRWANVVPTTLITNLTENEFSNEYGTAIIDRLRPIIIRFNWDSHKGSLNINRQEEPK